MRLLLVLVVLVGAGLAAAEEPADDLTREKARALWREDRDAFTKRLDDSTTAGLEALLDECLAADPREDTWLPRVVSRALARRILARRVEGLRDLAPAESDLTGAPRFEILGYPRTDGSTSTIPLERVIACRLLGSPYRWGHEALFHPTSGLYVSPYGGPIRAKRTPQLAAQVARGGVLADGRERSDERLATIINALLVRHTGTNGAWVNLIEREADLVLVARPPSPDELALASKAGVKLDTTPVARDAFVFLAHRTNPVTGLTIAQVRDVYTERVVSWKDLGGADARIQAYRRNPNSGSQELFLALVMKGEKPSGRQHSLIRDSMMGPYNALAGNPDGIAFTVWYYERYMALIPEVKILALDGVFPDPKTIASGEYPLVTTVHVGVRGDEPENSPARKLRNWLLSPAGQAVIAESGYLPLER